MSDAASFRVRRIQYATATSAASKVVTTLVQLVALPIAIRALGQDRFALYAILAAAIGWLGVTNLGVGPPLAVRIADAAAKHDEPAQRRLFTSALLPVSVVVAAIALVFSSLLGIVPTTSLFGPNYDNQAETIHLGLSVLLGIALCQAWLSVPEATQTGFQEQYVFNLWATVGNGASLLALLLVAALAPSVIAMIVAVNLPPLITRIVNSVRFLARRRYILPHRNSFAFADARFLLGNGIAFSLAASLGNFLNHQYMLVLVGRSSTTQETSTFAVILNVFMLAFGLLSMAIIPLWPAIADSLTRGEQRWARTAYNKALTWGLMYAVAFALGLTLIGRAVLRLWFGPTANPTMLLLSLTGVYFVADIWEYIHYNVLIGMGRIWLPSVVYLGRSIIAVALASLLLARLGGPGAMLALIVSVLVTTAPVFFALTRRELKRLEGLQTA